MFCEHKNAKRIKQRSANVVLLIDHDVSGVEQANKAALLLNGKVSSLKIIDLYQDEPLPEKHGKDVSDWLSEEHPAEELRDIIKRAPDFEKTKISAASGLNSSVFVIKPANEWLNDAKTRPVSRRLFGDLWFEDEICIFFSDTNLGKTILGVQIGESIARGLPQGSFTIETGEQRVLYIDFELSDKQFEHRDAERSGDYFSNHYEFSSNFQRAEINPDLEDIPP